MRWGARCHSYLTHRCSKQEVIGQKLHFQNVIEFLHTVELGAFRVIDVKPLLLCHSKHGLCVEPPDGTAQRLHHIRICIATRYLRTENGNVHALDVVHRFHDVHLTHKVFRLPLDAGHMTSFSTQQQMPIIKTKVVVWYTGYKKPYTLDIFFFLLFLHLTQINTSIYPFIILVFKMRTNAFLQPSP